MGYRLKYTLENWTNSAYHCAAHGIEAIENGIREVSKNEGIEIVSLVIVLIGAMGHYSISISHHDIDADNSKTLQQTMFEVYNPYIVHKTLENK